MSIVRGMLAEIRLIPMSLLLLTTILGGFFAVGPNINWSVMGLVLLNAFLYLYTAHLNDTYFDITREYEENRKLHSVRLNSEAYLPRLGFGAEIPNAPLLPRNYYLVGAVVCSILGTLVMIYVSIIVGWMYAVLAVLGLFLALTYSAGLDKTPALGDTMWETGVIAALWCGYYSQKMMLDKTIVMLSIPLYLALVTVKSLDGWYDVLVDDKNNKMTLPVFLYRKGLSLTAIRDLSYIPLYVALIILYLQLQPIFYPWLTGFTVLTAISHLKWRKTDMEERKGIVLLGIAIVVFISCVLLTMILTL